MIKDSGNRTKFDSGAVRDIQEGKGRCDLLPLTVIGCWCEDSAYDILGCVDLYRMRPSAEVMSAILNKFAYKHRDANGTCKGLERYRWDLVLEVAKHFEEGAKKYGDRNWEKGIPCYRYIDSAVRHYCKWRAGWTDEPHDRAFIWNILCCEWTRQRYGWNLERLEKSEANDIYDFSSVAGKKPLKKWENILGMKDSLLEYKWPDTPNSDFLTRCLNRYYSRSSVANKQLMSGSLEKIASYWHNQKRFTRDACEYLYDKNGHSVGCVWMLNAEKSLDICVKVACWWNNRDSDDITPEMLEKRLVELGWKAGIDFYVESFDDEESESKKCVKIGEQLAKGVYDGMHFNDDTEITMTVEGDFSNLFDMLGTEEPKKDQETADLKEACDIVERHNLCYNSPRDVCFAKSCKECNHYQDPNVVYKAVVQLLDHAKKSLNGGEEISNGYIRYVTGGIELYDDSGDYVGYVHGFLISKEDVAIIRSIVQECWGLLTFNPHTLKKIIEDHGYISDVHFLVELYKDPSDIKLPEKWQLIKRIAKEESK